MSKDCPTPKKGKGKGEPEKGKGKGKNGATGKGGRKGKGKEKGGESKGRGKGKGYQGAFWTCGKTGHKSWECAGKPIGSVEEAGEEEAEDEVNVGTVWNIGAVEKIVAAVVPMEVDRKIAKKVGKGSNKIDVEVRCTAAGRDPAADPFTSLPAQ